MDVLDAGVYVSKWEAKLPKGVQTVLWGPLQAKEMGFAGWQCQDGGETGFVYHNPQIKLPAGYATSTLIVVNRLKKAFLTIYFGGYPADLKREQRELDARKVVTACELFLERLAKAKVTFHMAGEIALVDNVNDAAVEMTTKHGELTDGGGGEDPPADADDAAAHGRRAAGKDDVVDVWEV